ncbi:MAG: biotin--[acetyl-CoA-carboxylase] ligase [Verrucomicrobiota bacterium]|nr:biotin--[acetyl-CoA-carboxylase] ligase [Verrucomicrobiota bacterium]
MKANAPLRAAELRADLAGCRIGRELHLLETTPSTNDALTERITGDTIWGLVVLAETQTAGRGQRGNRWESAPRQGLWLSILLRPEIALADSPQLTRWAAKTVRDFIVSACALPAETKMPNDVLVRGRKVAGVLVEMRAQRARPHVAILGIGLNVNQAPEDFSVPLRATATSLAIEAKRVFDRTKLVSALLRALYATYEFGD